MPEAIFYRDVVAGTGVRTLPGVYADADPTTRYCVVVTEDVVARGATFLDTLSEYGPDDTAQSLEQFATLHSSTWMSPALRDVDWFRPWFSDLTAIRGVPAIRDNFEGPIGALVPERVRDAYPPATYDRLQAIKRRYDPTNLFRFNQNVPPRA